MELSKRYEIEAWYRPSMGRLAGWRVWQSNIHTLEDAQGYKLQASLLGLRDPRIVEITRKVIE